MRTRPRIAVGIGLLVLAVGWMLRPEGFVDGPVLFTLTETHGIHTGDLVSVALGLAGLWFFGAA